MPLILLVLAALVFCLALTLNQLKHGESRKFLILYILLDLWLGGVLFFLLVTGVVS